MPFNPTTPLTTSAGNANLGEIVLLAGAQSIAFPNTLTMFSSNSGGGNITVDTTIEEQYEDTVEITEHPVEAGALISDHAFVRPMTVSLRCGWTDAGSYQFEVPSSSYIGGAMAASDYVAGVYSQLINLQQSLQTFSIFTGLRIYDTMIMTALRVRRDASTRYALMVEADCRQVILVSTQTSTLPPQANQASPASTADTVNAGAQAAQPNATPAPGGSNPASGWAGMVGQ